MPQPESNVQGSDSGLGHTPLSGTSNPLRCSFFRGLPTFPQRARQCISGVVGQEAKPRTSRGNIYNHCSCNYVKLGNRAQR